MHRLVSIVAAVALVAFALLAGGCRTRIVLAIGAGAPATISESESPTSKDITVSPHLSIPLSAF